MSKKKFKLFDEVYVKAIYIGDSPEGLRKLFVIPGTGIKVEVKAKDEYVFKKDEICEVKKKKKRKKKGE